MAAWTSLRIAVESGFGSGESVVDRWVQNPYWQYFCGFTHMQHEAPINPSSVSRWRKRVGAERLELLLKETIDLAVRGKQVHAKDLKQVTVGNPDESPATSFVSDH
ncbi:MAG: transposase [bacterium]|nr:transposase [bacterium]